MLLLQVDFGGLFSLFQGLSQGGGNSIFDLIMYKMTRYKGINVVQA